MDAPHRPILVVGIDEAGYGPLLGPLVVSAVAIEALPSSAEGCLWRQLRRCVSKTPLARDGRLPILDSKKLYLRKDGLARLERTALALITAAHELPPDVARLLSIIGPESLQLLAEHPWYQGEKAALPCEADAATIRIAASRLVNEGNHVHLRLVACAAEVLPEGPFNRLVNRTQNKAVVSMGLVLRLVQRMADLRPGCDMRIVIDRQGGREHYGSVLMRSFEDRRLRIVEETDENSAYELTHSASQWQMSFTTSCESRHLPVAAASIIAKYVRELLMASFNAWWLRELPDVRPTAGYFTDGLRFLNDIAPAAQRLGIPRDMLVRAR